MHTGLTVRPLPSAKTPVAAFVESLDLIQNRAHHPGRESLKGHPQRITDGEAQKTALEAILDRRSCSHGG